MDVGKAQYQNDEAIFITGTADPITEDQITLEIKDSLNALVGIEQVKIEELGSFNAVILPSELWNVNGTQKANVPNMFKNV